jgi:hypothetical protein
MLIYHDSWIYFVFTHSRKITFKYKYWIIVIILIFMKILTIISCNVYNWINCLGKYNFCLFYIKQRY